MLATWQLCNCKNYEHHQILNVFLWPVPNPHNLAQVAGSIHVLCYALDTVSCTVVKHRIQPVLYQIDALALWDSLLWNGCELRQEIKWWVKIVSPQAYPSARWHFFGVAVAFPLPPHTLLIFSLAIFISGVERGQDYTLTVKYLQVLVDMHLRANLVFKEKLKSYDVFIQKSCHCEAVHSFCWGMCISCNKTLKTKGKEHFDSNTITFICYIDYSI